MLRFTHDGETIDVEVEKLALHEAFAIQKATSHKLPAFLKAMEAGDAEAYIALGWMIIKYRMGRGDVTFDDVAEGKVSVLFTDFENTEAGQQADPTVAAATTPS